MKKRILVPLLIILVTLCSCSDYNSISMTRDEFNRYMQDSISPVVVEMTTQQLMSVQVAQGNADIKQAINSVCCAITVIDENIANVNNIPTKQYSAGKQEVIFLLSQSKNVLEAYKADLISFPEDADSCFKAHAEYMQTQINDLTAWTYRGTSETSSDLIESSAYEA